MNRRAPNRGYPDLPQADGFRLLSPYDVAEFENNFERNINEFSPFSGPVLPGASDWFVDSFFGQLYTGVSIHSEGIYGITSEMPHYPEDKLANFGYLRVPFRRIPRRIIKSKTELYALVGSLRRANPAHELLFRGQVTEYMLNRSKKASLLLYGEEQVLEPSLTASAVRKGVDIDEFTLSWTFILKDYYCRYVDELSETASASEKRGIFDEYRRFQFSYTQELFSLALAQHYGLPSVGLDLSTEPDVALFFAFNRFVRTEKRSPYARYERATTTNGPPVLYVLAPQDRFQLDYKHLKPRSFPTARPDAQRARFMHTGWGLNQNYAAKRILVALYLDLSESDIDSIPKAEDLFPRLEDDSFAQFLLKIRKVLPTKLLEPFYILS
jgi:hypothetical protein